MSAAVSKMNGNAFQEALAYLASELGKRYQTNVVKRLVAPASQRRFDNLRHFQTVLHRAVA